MKKAFSQSFSSLRQVVGELSVYSLFLKPTRICKSEEVCLCVRHIVGSMALPFVFLNTLMLHMQVKVPYLVFPPDCKGSSSFQYKQPTLLLHLLRIAADQKKWKGQSVCPSLYSMSCPSFSDHLGELCGSIPCIMSYIE